MLDPRLRLGRKQRALVTEMLEMGWLFTMVVRYIQNVDGEKTWCDTASRDWVASHWLKLPDVVLSYLTLR